MTEGDLAARLRRAVRDREEPLWFPSLAANLAAESWRGLRADLGLTPDNYGTLRVLRKSPRARRRVIASFVAAPRCPDVHAVILVESLPARVGRSLAGPGMLFLRGEQVGGTPVSTCVAEALAILDEVPTVLPTVARLIRVLHLIDPVDQEFDVSFSLPNLPFSAFVSVPAQASDGPPRVAEALLHEAMHLQLTILEGVVPLVADGERDYYSPWRQEFRSARGVLHALYVFRVIDAFLEGVLSAGISLRSLASYAKDRRAAIAGQVREVAGFRECGELTGDGVAFVERLLAEVA